MTDPLELKRTLNLPRTDFPMKANLPQSEPRQLAAWEEQRIYHRVIESRAAAEPYVFHDGPPYPTGEIHLGTGLNKVLKDMVVKSKTMAGFRTPYVPGWDCHGLPIETKVEKELGGKGKVPPAEFRRLCRAYAARFIENHRRQFKRLGIFGLWEKPYLTMDYGYEAAIADAFLTFYEKGYVYRGLKPVYWCIYDGTALAEAEVEYENHTSPSIWVRYKLYGAPGNNPVPGFLVNRTVYAIIWTTTPWTIPASLALTFHPDFEYAAVEANDGNVYLMADQLKDSVLEKCGLISKAVLGKVRGKHVEHWIFEHPFIELGDPRFPNKAILGILGPHVTLDAGSGIVHTAPGHGAEDFYVGQKYGLPAYAPLDDAGRFTAGLDDYKGKTVFEANEAISVLLMKKRALLGTSKLTHSYPHCWRCHNPVIFRATEQWFINLEHENFRQRALDEIKRVQWKPAWGEERITSMIATRPDWCISRQRFWGVPLVVFYCGKCNLQLRDFAALRNVVEIFRRVGADAWFERPPEELLPAGTKCSCGAADWRKETDILDVWFESGSSHHAVLGPGREAGDWPADMYLEGPDQYRGWFHSSLLVAVGVRGRAPYHEVVTHGWTLDEKGQPMSKSLGNAIYPEEICEKWGADILRAWVAWQDYTADVNLGPALITQLTEAYRKVRNTFRYALGNLFDFDPNRDALADAELLEMDRWMLSRTAQLVADCRRFYDDYDFHRVFHALHDFCVVDLSATYFDVLKDRLYTSAPRSRARRSAQTAVHRIASVLARLAAPILVFTAEEVWKYFPRRAGDPESVHMALFPVAEELGAPLEPAQTAAWEHLLAVRGEVLKALEAARQSKQINSSLEAKVVLAAGGETAALVERYRQWLPALFIVSQVELEADGAELAARVLRADGVKCERCWNYSTRVGQDARYPTVCERCSAVLAEIERERAVPTGRDAGA